MNSILADYLGRYKPAKPFPKVDLSTFFTALPLDQVSTKLPFLFNIENFCLRLLIAMQNNERICIYSDYDTDAVTATGVAYHGLLELGFLPENLDFYAPDRFTEGYGMNTEAVEMLTTKFDLIISVDCGINSVLEAKICQNTTCDLIITDHHHLADQVPDCVAVINPRLSEYYYTNSKELKKINSKLLKQVQKTLPKKRFDSMKSWLESVSKNPAEYESNYDILLSYSVTGVGVAWFSLLWLAYFLEVVEWQW